MWLNVQHSHIESHNASDRHAGCRLHAVNEEKGGMCGRRHQEGSAANCHSRREACDVGNRPREIRGSVRGIPVNVPMPTTTRTQRTSQQMWLRCEPTWPNCITNRPPTEWPRVKQRLSGAFASVLPSPTVPAVVTNLMEDVHPNCWNRCGTAPQQRSSS